MSDFYKNIFNPTPYFEHNLSAAGSVDPDLDQMMGAVKYQIPVDQQNQVLDQYLKYKSFDLLPDDQKETLRGMIAKLPSASRALLLGKLNNSFALVSLQGR